MHQGPPGPQGPPPGDAPSSLLSVAGIKYLWGFDSFRSMVYGHVRSLGFFAGACVLIAKYGELFDIYA